MADILIPTQRDGYKRRLKDMGDGTYAEVVSANVTSGQGGDASAANQVIQTNKLTSIDNDVLALSAKLPASLGSKTGAASLSIAPASDAVFSVGQTSLVRGVLLAAATALTAGAAMADSGRPPSFTAEVTGTGAVSATILIQARNVSGGQWITLATIALSGTTAASDGFLSLGRYMEYRANLTAVSGTSAAVSVAMGS